MGLLAKGALEEGGKGGFAKMGIVFIGFWIPARSLERNNAAGDNE